MQARSLSPQVIRTHVQAEHTCLNPIFIAVAAGVVGTQEKGEGEGGSLFIFTADVQFYADISEVALPRPTTTTILN